MSHNCLDSYDYELLNAVGMTVCHVALLFLMTDMKLEVQVQNVKTRYIVFILYMQLESKLHSRLHAAELTAFCRYIF